MEALEQKAEEIMQAIMPATADELRQVLVDAGFVNTHKAAQEQHVSRFLARQRLGEAAVAESMA